MFLSALLLPVLISGCTDKDDTGCLSDCDTAVEVPVYQGWSSQRVPLGEEVHTFLGESPADKAGFHVAGVGDVNADGLGDLLITADTSGDAGRDGGKAYLVSGGDVGTPGESQLSDAWRMWLAESEEDLLGHSGAGVGDLDGDGLGDLLVSAYIDAAGGVDVGTVYLLTGAEIGEGTDLDEVAHRFVGENDLNRLGHGLDGGGDVDADGVPDVLLGAYGNAEIGYNSGKAYLLLGSSISPGVHSVAEADQALVGEAYGDKAGFNVSFAGDVDGDGRDDLLVGAKWNDEVETKAGKAYLVLAESLLGQDENLSLAAADAMFLGENAQDQCCVMEGAGDVDGDGLDDLLMGAQYDEVDSTGSGRVYLVLASSLAEGGARSLSEADWRFQGEELGDALGISVAGVGDLDGDSLPDLLLGGFRHSPGGAEEGGGAAYLFLAGRLPDPGIVDVGVADHIFEGMEAWGAAGRSVSGAGDVNGDGLLDLVVGAPMEQDYAELGAGRAHLILSP